MKNIGLILGVFVAMILAAVVTRKCGYVYTDTYPTAAEQRLAVERGDTVKSGYDKKTGEATVADTTRKVYYACGSRVNGHDWPVGVVGLIVLAVGLWHFNKKPKEVDDDSHAPTDGTPTDTQKTWVCSADGTRNESYRKFCVKCGRPRTEVEAL